METEAPIQVAQLNINNSNFPVYQGVNTIGRNRQAIINITHMNISQSHAIIVTLQDAHYISDLKSSNGTFVDGTKLKPFKLYPLTHYTNIVLGTLNGTYSCKGDFSSTTNLNTSLETQSFYNKNTQLLEVSQSLDLHDAPTQRISWAKPLNNLKVLPTVPKTICKEPIVTDNTSLTLAEIDQYNDEELPLLTHNENFMEPDNEIKLNEEDAETEVMAIERPSRPVFVEEDDELTDCEENEKFSDTLKSVEYHALREDSNDSLQFLNSGSSPTNKELGNNLKIIDSNGIIESQVVQHDAEHHVSDDSDSPIIARTARKRVHVISTQDLLEKNNMKKSSVEQAHTVLANESSSKNQTYDISISAANSSMFDVSIPATQDKSGWNDSDCIPPTQFVSIPPSRAPQNRGENSQLSEENFKLGLTQLINFSSNESDKGTEDSFLAVTQNIVSDICISTIKVQSHQKADYEVQNTCDDSPKAENIVQKRTHIALEEPFDKVRNELSVAQDKDGTQKVVMDVSQVLDCTPPLNPSKSQEEDICDTATQKVFSEDYMKPTQEMFINPNATPICDGKHIDNGASQTVSSHIFMEPTQRISQNTMEFDDDIFVAPTQKMIFKPNVTLMEDDEEVYNAATQKVISDVFMEPIQNMSTIESGKAVEEAPTQVVIFKSNVTDDKNVYDQATQKIPSNVFMKPTQKKNSVKSDKDILGVATIDEEENVYDAVTQKIPLNTLDQHENSLDVYDAPTQKVSVFKKGMSLIDNNERVFDAPIQKVCESQQSDGDICAQKLGLSSIINPRKDEDIYDSSTEKISRSVDILRQKDEVSLVSIQMDSPLKKISNSGEELCIEPAQKIVSNLAEDWKKLDVHLVPLRNTITGYEDKIKEVELKKNEDLSLIKDAKNQKNDVLKIVEDPIPQNDIHKVSSTDEDAVSDTRIENSVQKPVDSSIETVELVAKAQLQTEKKKIKKSFSFKKTPCNLDASLSVLSNEPKISAKSLLDKPAIQSSNMHQNFLENLSNSSSHSEVNQSMALAESKLSKTRKITKGTKITVSVPKNQQSVTIAKPEVVEERVKEKPKKRRNAKKSSEAKAIWTRTKTQQNNDDEGRIASRSVKRKTLKSQMEKTQAVLEMLHGKAKNTKDNLELPSRRQDLKKRNTVKSDNGDEASLEYTALARQTSKRSKITSQEDFHCISSRRDTSCKQDNSLEDAMKKSSGKRKKTVVEEETIIAASPPKKMKIQGMPNTPQRESRRYKPKVVFTMLESPQLESLIKQLGGNMVFSIETCSVLVTEHIKRSQKLLTAIGLGKPICSPKWITDSKQKREFLDPWNYILTDPEAEQKWNFSLRESLNRSQAKKLFNLYSFHIQVTAGADVLKATIEACGGKCLPKIPGGHLENAYVISLKENHSKYSRILKKHPHFKVIEPEAVFDAALRQELRFFRHILT